VGAELVRQVPVEHLGQLVKQPALPGPEKQRAQARQADPAKQWKITDEDWRNREKWDQYEVAVNDMIRYTSTDFAPWHIIAGNDKYYARIQALQIINDMIGERLKQIR